MWYLQANKWVIFTNRTENVNILIQFANPCYPDISLSIIFSCNLYVYDFPVRS